MVVATLLTFGVAAVIRMSSGTAAKPAGGSQPSQVGDQARAVEPQVPPGQAKAVADEVDQLRNSQPVAPRISSSRNRIAGEASLHPDLYASAFVKELLTQNYGTPRDDLLSWVQEESAQRNEPRVVGLIPSELRSKWAVFSVSSGPTPRPDDSRLELPGTAPRAHHGRDPARGRTGALVNRGRSRRHQRPGSHRT